MTRDTDSNRRTGNPRKDSSSGQARRRDEGRRGAAVVEMAIAGSMLIVLLLVMIDTAQYIMIHQVVSNASRAAARHAARDSTADTSEVQATAQNYLTEALPSVTSSMISNALTVTVSDGAGGTPVPITGAIATDVQSGDPIVVDVSFGYDATRWLSAFVALNSRTIEARTVMRRE